MKDLTPLWQALARAQRALGGLAKDAKGARGEYTSCEAAISAARRVLLNEGLLLVVESARVEEIAPADMDEHGAITRSDQLVLNRQFRLVHDFTGGSITFHQVWPVLAGRGRPIDHATASADSFGLTYFLRGLLLFPRGHAYEGEAEVITEDVSEPMRYDKPIEAQKQAPPPDPKPEAAQVAEVVSSTAQALDASMTADANDPTAEDLARYGWDENAPSTADLEALPADEPVDVALARDLHIIANERVGKTAAYSAWRALGVNLKKRELPTGLQARKFAATIAFRTTKKPA